jgi:hypothetical protein
VSPIGHKLQASNLRAVRILLGNSKIENTVQYLGVDADDALLLSERGDLARPGSPDLKGADFRANERKSGFKRPKTVSERLETGR